MEKFDLNSNESFATTSNQQTRPDEIYIRSDHPDANDYIMVGGRCYKKTNDESDTYSITSENIFSGLLEKTPVTIVNPHDDVKSLSKTRTDLKFKKFDDCPDCIASGERFRGQQKKNYRDFLIKVVKENDDDVGGVVTYRFQGEDRNGEFPWTGNKEINILHTDSLTFDVTALGADASKFTITGISTDKTSRPGFVIIGSPRYDSLLVDQPEFVEKTNLAGTFVYSESGGPDNLKGNIKVSTNHLVGNSEYNDEKLKQFPDRLHLARRHSLLIKNDGRVYGSGKNDVHSLGIRRDRKTDTSFDWYSTWTDTEINKIGPIKKVFGHHATTGFLTNDNKLYVCGWNETYQLGQGDKNNRAIPQMIKISHPTDATENIFLSEDIHTQIVDAEIGVHHGIALDVNQRIWAWGAPGNSGCAFVSLDNTEGGNSNWYGKNYNNEDPREQYKYRDNWNFGYVKSFSRAKLIYWDSDYARDSKSAYLTDPTLFELNIPGNKIYQVTCGGYASFVLTLDGKVFSSGFNGYGNLGQNNVTKHSDVAVTEQPHPAFGTVYNTGGRLEGDEQDASKIWVKKVIPGLRHTLLLTYDNKLYGFGKNDQGQLGVDTTNEYSEIPVLLAEDVYRAFAGSNSSAYISNNGKVFVCGYNLNGKLGIDRFAETAPIPAPLNSSEKIERWTECNRLMGAIEIKMGHFHTMGLLSNGEIVGFGESGEGQLASINHLLKENENSGGAYEKNYDVDFPRASGMISECGRTPLFDEHERTILAGPWQSIIWSKESSTQPNRVETFGNNNQKSLGYTDTDVNKNEPYDITESISKVLADNADITQIKTMGYHQLLFLNSEKRLFRMGTDVSGLPVASSATELLYQDEPLENVKLFSPGNWHSLAVDTSNRLYAWGHPGNHGSCFIELNSNKEGNSNWYGKSYYNENPNRQYQYRDSWNAGYVKKLPIKLLNDGEEQILPKYVGSIQDVKCSYASSFILNDKGELFSAGFNGNGELGQGHIKHYWDLERNTGIHRSFGRVFSFDGIRDIRVKRVIAGPRTIFAIMEDNSLYGWGNNNNYQLGKSEENTKEKVHHKFYASPILIDTDVDDVFVGENNTAVKKLDGNIYAMGRNTSGLLAMFGDGRSLGLDRFDSINGEKTSTRYAKNPIPLFEASDNITEIAFGRYHSIIKQIDRENKKITYFSAGNNLYGQRGIEGLTPGGLTGDNEGQWSASYDNEKDLDTSSYVKYFGSDRWTKIRHIEYA